MSDKSVKTAFLDEVIKSRSVGNDFRNILKYILNGGLDDDCCGKKSRSV